MIAPSTDGDTSSPSGSEDASSLYDPPVEEGEEMGTDGADPETLKIRIPRDMARRLLRVSMHLGLSPSLVASRAIDLVWDEIGTVSEEDSLSTQTLIQRYQARVDILQILESGLEEEVDGSATKSESSQSPGSSTEDADDRFEGDQLWNPIDKIDDGLSEQEGKGSPSASRSGSTHADAGAPDVMPPQEELADETPRRPEKEEHSWDEVDEIIETGEETKDGS